MPLLELPKRLRRRLSPRASHLHRLRLFFPWSPALSSRREDEHHGLRLKRMPGRRISSSQASSQDTRFFLGLFVPVSSLVFSLFRILSLHLIVPPYTNMRTPSRLSSKRRLRPAVTLAPSLVSKSKIPSAHSSLPLSPSYQKLGSPENFVLLKIYLIHALRSCYCRHPHPQSRYLPSTPLSKLPTSLAHGAPSPSSRSGSTSSRPVLSLHVVTSPTRSAQSLPIHHNGQDPSSAPVTMSSSSIPMSCLASPRVWESMVPSQMLVPTFSVGREWGQSPSGWTTTCSLGYSANTSPSTTDDVLPLISVSKPTADGVKMDLASGTRARPFRMGESRNSTTTANFRCKTYPPVHLAHLWTLGSHTVWPTSTNYPKNWASFGARIRTSHSGRSAHSQAWSGTLRDGWCRSGRQRNRNISTPSRCGVSSGPTSFRKHKNSMASFCTSVRSYHEDERFSPTWRPYSNSPMIVHSFRSPLHPAQLKTSNGGVVHSHDRSSPGLSSFRPWSRTQAPSRMQALEQGSGSLSGVDGEHGDFSLAGSRTGATLVGRRPWASSYSSEPYSASPTVHHISRCTVTIKEWSKDGGRTEAATRPSTQSSVESTTSLKRRMARYTPATYQPIPIPQTTHPEVSTARILSYYRRSKSPTPLRHTLSTSMPPYLPWRKRLALSSPTNHSRKSSMTKRADGAPISTLNLRLSATPSSLTRSTGGTEHSFGAVISLPYRLPVAQRPRPYHSHLTPLPSPLRPHCFARERLLVWRPESSRVATDQFGRPLPLSPFDLERLQAVLAHAWADSSYETYGSGLLLYHIFCDIFNISEFQRAPTSPVIMSLFISMLAGSYSSSAIANAVAAVQAWHTLHGVLWVMDKKEIGLMLKAAERLVPESSRRPKRDPFTIEMLDAIGSSLDLTDSFNACFWSCLTTTFYATARLGEFTLPTLNAFNGSDHVKRSDIRRAVDDEGNEVTIFHLPRTKSAPIDGEDVFWARQPNAISDPERALQLHLLINDHGDNCALFSYTDNRGSQRPLTKTAFLTKLTELGDLLNMQFPHGHGIRIGSTVWNLLRGMPFEVMRVKGRWKSSAFLLYLRRHAEILARYIQQNPQLQEALRRITLPPIR
ncbi:uncharacterized protein STEHIDRAFT_87996 [Stereum hirsutum FP-91666 SS1]|uniref:DNA breaking-rejoining enzyme n=1 Tax=Stereum hirsutum (strain FP-91666) TaxID=721885 RepID=R7RXW6_STEHR|nr:uncharacterized protein STEHIDRAFT_87996 [Stereum hirsutum FP-91666 SS1]EIM79638.1 hypothetical protein STEHIDRAFT_87996 [Stereum hirsutum FP-91666 SS1]